MKVDEASEALGLSKAGVYDLLRKGHLAGRKVPDPDHPRNGLSWDVSPQSVASEKRLRESGKPRPKPQPVFIKLPDMKDALANGELENLGPEAVADWIRKLRAEALEAQRD